MDFNTIKVPRDSNVAESVWAEIQKLGRHESISIHKDVMSKLASSCLSKIPCKGDSSIIYCFKNANGKHFALETADIDTNREWFDITATVYSVFYTYQKIGNTPFTIIFES